MVTHPLHHPRRRTVIARRGLALLLIAALTLAVFPATRPAPAAAQNDVIWSAEFFNNEYLLGDNVFETQYAGLALDWGEGSPAPEVDADGFSGRFGTDVFFQAGTYRFYLLADDAVSLTIDFLPLGQQPINTFNDAQPGALLTADVTLSGGFHHLQVDYRETAGDAYVFLSWANVATNPSPPAFPVTPTVSLVNPWTVQYYNNAALTGAPVLARTEDSISQNWGQDAPAPEVDADNFSSRWNSIQNLSPGIYEVRVQADDGVRVFVNGSLLISEWHGATGQTYTAQFNHAGGQISFTVEHYDAVANAFLDFRVVQPAPDVPDTPASAPTGQTATVTAWRLNVRDEPSTTTGTILVKIDQGESYPVLSFNADRSWVQINVNGTIGWVSARYVNLNAAAPPPAPVPTATPDFADPAATGYFVTAQSNVSIYSAPSFDAQVIGLVPYQQLAGVVGRKADNSWWQVQYGAVTGWVSNFYVTLQAGANVNIIPITG